MREIVPVHQIKRRVPEQGRIRMGVKQLTGGLDKNGKPKSRPAKLSRLRFTSADRRALDVIADKYGGEVTPWTDGPEEALFQVTVTQEKIPVVLPPDPLSGTPIYEHWSGGGCLRRCDGIDCAIPSAGADEQQVVVACPCRAQNMMACKPRTRLNVVLQDVPFGGTWRLESTGWNAAEELPGMVDMVLTVQETGMAMGELSIAKRTRLVNGMTKRFIVPSLTLPESILALAEGQMRLRALGKVREIAGDLAALPAGREVDEPTDETEPDWIDAEVVDDEEPDGGRDRAPGEPGRSGAPSSTGNGAKPDDPAGNPPAEGSTSGAAAGTAPEPPKKKRGPQSPRVKALHAGVRQLLDVPDVAEHLTSHKIAEQSDQLRHGLVLLVTEGRSESTSETTDAEQQRMLNLVGDLLSGDRRLIGFAEDGHVRLSGKRAEASNADLLSGVFDSARGGQRDTPE